MVAAKDEAKQLFDIQADQLEKNNLLVEKSTPALNAISDELQTVYSKLRKESLAN